MTVVWVLHMFLAVLVGHVASNPCGDALTGSSGFLTSKNFPGDFSQYEDCAWNITVPAGHIIKLTFLNFTLEPNQNTDCTSASGARLSITNVASNDNNSPFQLCGQKVPAPVYSVGNFIQVRLISGNNVFSGFNASYEAITENDICPAPGAVAKLNETGVITSPFYPRRYPKNKDCNWQITAKKGSHVKLEFDNMDISGGINCGTLDFLDIQNGYTSDGSATGKHCKDPGVIYSVLDSLKVRFFSDGANVMATAGFKATYTLLNFTPPVCPKEAIPLTGNGTFSSPSYPNKYLSERFCAWNITVPEGKRVKFVFTDFRLGFCSSPCSSQYCTYVEMYDGASESSPYLGRFCYNSAQKEVISSGNKMLVKFHGGAFREPGFEAQYSETSDTPSPTVVKPTTPPTTTTAKPPTTTGAIVTATVLSVSLPILAASIFWL
ncbi:hypothetical protein ACROYT_G019466 [Oculina patagonica]